MATARSPLPSLAPLCPASAMTTGDELQKMVKEFDSDGDRFIDFQEFVELNNHGVDTANLRDAFSVYLLVSIC
ncbi:hypothetical protein M5689_020611 [Euphorbia peplus]|nr:hypothetical protein M5689_020611 [Euphorbia peplus]